MSRIGLIEGYDEKKVREALDLLLRDRKNEFRELAGAIGIPTTSEDWEVIILKFCLDFEECFKIMREMAKGKSQIHELINIQDIAFNLYTEFHHTYDRITD
jgi:hypothetical protein